MCCSVWLYFVAACAVMFSLLGQPLFVVAESIRLNDRLPEGGKVVGYWISPDSSRVVYQASGNEEYVYELFSAPIDRAGGQ